MARSACCLLIFLLMSPSLLAESAVPPEKTIEDLYAAKLEKVKATRDRADDVALAGELVAAAEDARPELARLLCAKAYDLAQNPLGWDKAAEAKRLLAERIPEESARHLDDAVDAYWQSLKRARGPARKEVGEALVKTALEAADTLARQADVEAVAMGRQAERAARLAAPRLLPEVRHRQGKISQRVRLEKEVGGLMKRLEADPDNAAVATQLVRTFVMELDEPQRALPYLEKCDDAEMKKYVPGAAKPVGEAPELACQELGTWYATLAEEARSMAKEHMLVRAWRYLERYLRIHEAEDLARAEAAKVMARVEEALEELGPPKGLVVGPGRWVELLPRIDLAKDVVKGNWERQGPFLVSTYTSTGRLPCLPEGDYQLQVRLISKRVYRLQFILPVRSTAALYRFSSSDKTFGSLVNMGMRDSPSVAPGQVQRGKGYVLDMRVSTEKDQARIRVRLDGRPHLEWAGAQSALDPERLEVSDRRFPYVHGYKAPTIFKSIRCRMISGEMRLLR